MTAFTDEAFYREQYLCGREPAVTSAFAFYAAQATAIIKQYTLDNVDEDNIPEEVKMCCCELAESIYTAEQSGAKGVAAESVGGWSVSYESSEQRRQTAAVGVRDIVYKWLSGTGLLYRGVM